MSANPEQAIAPLPSKSRLRKRRFWLSLAAMGVVAGAPFAYFVGQAREAGRLSRCACRLTQIGLALQNYESQYGVYPPAYQRLDGQPSCSWRLELVPMMGLQAEYDRYRRNELWSSPFNRSHADQVAALYPLYRCPSAPAAQAQPLANYVMPTGPHAMSPGPTGVKRAAIVDGTSWTIAVAEIAATDIYWAEPRDLNTRAMSFQVNSRSQPGISSAHGPRAMVLFADGHTQSMPSSIDPQVLESLLTVDGNEPFPAPLH